jgi:AbrB family looped-hinge helix DNA binding protein
MDVKLSSKGQLVIPQSIRQALDLKPGTTVTIELVGKQIVLQSKNGKTELLGVMEQLHALAKGSDLLDMLAEERIQERDRENRREQSLFTG